jgi:hypothetical protein
MENKKEKRESKEMLKLLSHSPNFHQGWNWTKRKELKKQSNFKRKLRALVSAHLLQSKSQTSRGSTENSLRS